MLYYIICIISLLFGILSMFAALSQYKNAKKPTPHLVMALGSGILMFAIVAAVSCPVFDWIFALAGCGLICGAAIYNGRTSGNFHPVHHIIRIGLSVFLVAGFIIC